MLANVVGMFPASWVTVEVQPQNLLKPVPSSNVILNHCLTFFNQIFCINFTSSTPKRVRSLQVKLK